MLAEELPPMDVFVPFARLSTARMSAVTSRGSKGFAMNPSAPASSPTILSAGCERAEMMMTGMLLSRRSA